MLPHSRGAPAVWACLCVVLLLLCCLCAAYDVPVAEDVVLLGSLVWPAYTSVQGGAVLGIVTDFHGASFALRRPRVDLGCKFGTAVVAARVARPGLVECNAPAHSPGFVRVELALNNDTAGLHSLTDTAALLYRLPATISALHPAAGVTGSPVSVVGDGFAPGATCHFEGIPVPATFESTRLARCPIPAGLQAGPVAVTLSNGGDQAAGGVMAAEFTVLEEPFVSRATPLTGPFTGGTRVQVSGTGLELSDARCCFGAVCTSAAQAPGAGGMQLECVAPAYQASGGQAVFWIDLGKGVAVDADSRMAFRFSRAPGVRAVVPEDISAAGGVAVQVFVGNAVTHMAAACRMGSGPLSAAAYFAGLDAFRCFCLPGDTGFTVLHLDAGDGVDWTAGAAVQVVTSPMIRPAPSSSGPPWGGTLLFAAGFDATEAALCRFGDSPAPTVFVSSVLLVCEQPALDAGPVPLDFSGTNDNVAALFRAEHTVARPAVATVLTPPHGVDAGGTAVVAMARDISDDAAAVVCRLGTTDVAGAKLSAVAVRCVSAAHAPGSIPAQLSARSQLAPLPWLPFQYEPAPGLLRIGVDSAAGRLLLHGFSLPVHDGMSCLLDGAAVPGAAVSATLVGCALPAPWVGSLGYVELRLLQTEAVVASSEQRVGDHFQAPAAAVYRVFPAMAPTAGGTLVTVRGSDFGQGAICVFRGSPDVRQAVVVSTAVSVCETPAVAEPGPSGFGVTGDTTDADVGITFFSAPAIIDFEAPYGFTTGGTAVRLAVDIDPGRDVLLFCRFDSISYVTTTWSSNGELSCTAPARGAGTVPVHLTGFSNSLEAAAGGFTYVAAPLLQAVLPDVVSASVFSTVTLPLSQLLPLPFFCSTKQLSTPMRPAGDGLACDVSPDSVGFFTLEISVPQSDPVARFQLAATPRVVLFGASPVTGVAGGGTLRFLSGSHFSPLDMRCVYDASFGSAAFAVSSALAVCEGGDLGSTTGQLSLLSAAGVSGSLLYRTAPPPYPTSLTPEVSNILGTTTVSVAVLQAGSIVACRVGTFFPVAATVGSADVRCLAPAHAPGSVPVGLSPNSRDADFVPGLLAYHAPAAPTGLSPPAAPTEGGTPCLVTLDKVLSGQQPQCSVGPAQSGAESVAGAAVPSVVCVVPAHAAGFTALMLQYSNDAAVSAGLFFEYRLPGSVWSMQPKLVVPGTVVTVSTADAHQGAACAFTSDAAWPGGTAVLSTALVRCEATQSPGLSATMPLDVLSLSSLSWTFVTGASVLSVAPVWGTSDGGTSVALQCSLPQTLCRFATTGPIAGRPDGNTLVCDTPAHVTRPVALASSAELPAWSPMGATFVYLGRVTATAVLSPASISTTGLTTVTVAADGVVPGVLPTCLVGLLSSMAMYEPDNRMACPVAGVGPGFTTVAIGAPGGLADGATELEVHVPSAALYAFPSVVAAEGGSVISLAMIDGLPTGSCVFGSAVAPGAWVSSALMRCEAIGGDPGAVVALTAEASSSSRSFTAVEFQPALLVTGSTPAAGPETGGTLTTVTTSVRASDSPLLACGFGTLFPVAASWVSASVLQCSSPATYPSATAVAVYPRAVPLFASANGADRITADVFFEVQAGVHIGAITPRSGIHLGQTPVFISGAGFVNSTDLACRFGLVPVPATFLSYANLLCVAPAQAPGPVFVEVTNNGQDFTTDRVLFFYGTCPLGHYCPDGEALACPRGSFCAGTSNFNFTLCPPGTFQSQTGQAACLPAPVGFFAPDFGMVMPRLCPRGLVCDLTGLAGGLAACPPGHYCLEGTRTANFSDFRVSERPLPCPFGFFCGSGVTTSTSIANNLTTPQPCAPGYLCEPGSVTPQGSGPCPTGYYCPAGQFIPCPPRTYCPNVGNTQPTPCLPGMYNDQSGLSTCKQCPVGTVCPGFTRQLPEPCPPGYVCDTVGLPLPITRCPAGHFCLENTLTTDPLAPLDDQQLLRALPSGFTLNVSNFRPFPCYPATFCLDGVGNSTTVAGDYFHPQPCNAGSYCEWATSDVTVAAAAGSTDISNPKLPCPGGSYCPQGTYIPIPAPRGSFASGTGNAQAALCLPGTYTHYEGFQSCLSCPAGYECRTDGTYKPTICGAGNYRSTRDSITCLSCPAGTWSPYRGLTDEALCLPCKPGLVCGVDGMTNSKPYGQQGQVQTTNDNIAACETTPPGPTCRQIALQPLGQAVLCPEGYVCDARTTIANAKCPDGYFCGLGTTPETQFANPCPAGYYCPAGSGASARNQFPCQACFYCPSGTGIIPFRCPNGTQSVSGSKTINDCSADQITFWRVSPLHTALINRVYALASGNATSSNSSNMTSGSGSGTNSSQASNSTNSSTPTGIPGALDLLNSYPRCSPSAFDALQPAFVTNPENPDVAITDIEGQPLVYFQLPRNYIAKVRLDFRNISSTLVYGSHYEVAIFTGNFALQSTCDATDYQKVPCPPWSTGDGINLATMGVIQSQLNEVKCPRSTNGLELPFWFARNGLYGQSTNNVQSPVSGTYVDKRDMLELNLMANDDLQFRVEIRMLDGRYQSANRRSFLDTMCIDLVAPQRGGTANSSFHIIYPRNDNFQLPLNAPVEAQKQRSVVKNYLDCTATGGLTVDPTCRLVQPEVTLAFNSSFSSEYLLAQGLLTSLAAAANGTVTNASSTSSEAVVYNPLAGIPLVTPLPTTSTTVPDVIALEANVLQDANNFWSTGDSLVAIDYLPFFSACRGFDSNAYLWDILQTEWTPNADLSVGYGTGCQLFSPDETVFISQWAPQIFNVVADVCDISFTCLLQENYQAASAVTRWFEANGDALFYMTEEPEERDLLFESSVASSSTSIPPHDTSYYAAKLATQGLMRVNFGPAAGVYVPGTVPKMVTLELTYFPYTAENKRLVSTAVTMDGYLAASTHNGEYTLNILLTPLGWFELLNAFAFDTQFYTVLFVGIGVISDFVLWGFWLATRLFTRLRDPPKFKGVSLLSLLIEQQVTGIFLAMLPFALGELAVRQMFLNFTWYINFSGNIDTYLTSNADAVTVSGRIGLTFIVMGMFGLWCGSSILVPERPRDDTEALLRATGEEDEEEEFFTPIRWRRTHFISGCLIIIVCELYLAEFSTVATYNTYLFFCWFGMKWYHFLLENVCDLFLAEAFMVSAIGCISECVEGFVTIAAATFTEFALAYILDVMYDAFEALFLDVGLEIMGEYASGTVKRLERLYYRVSKRTITQQLLHGGEEEEEEEGTLEAVMEALVSYSPKGASKIVLPFCLYLCWDFNAQLQYTTLWGIRRSDLLLYTLFLVVAIPFQWLQATYIFNALELFRGFQVYDYLRYAKYRFQTRTARWKGFEAHFDESIEPGLRSSDQMCFSSQWYFVLSIVGGFGVMLMFGILMLIRAAYNPFGDILFLMTVLLVTLGCNLGSQAAIALADLASLWKIRESGDTHDEHDAMFNPAELVLAPTGRRQERRQPAVEQVPYDFTSADIASEAFKRAFLEQNRMWLLEQLGDAVAPRRTRRSALGALSSDDDSVEEDDMFGPVTMSPTSVDALRQWAAAAIARAPGRHRRAPAEAILTTDDEDEPAFPPAALSQTAAAVLSGWLGAARSVRRRTPPDVLSSSGETTSHTTSSYVDIPLQPASQAAALAWLAVSRQRAARNVPETAMSLTSSSRGTSDSSSDDAAMPANLSARARGIVLAWLYTARRSFATTDI